MVDIALEAFVRGGAVGVKGPLNLNGNRDLLVAQGLPPYVEITRQGQGWSAMSTAAIAALVVRPTTVANATLWNNHADGGKSLVIDRAFAHNLVGVANSGFGIWLCVHKRGMVAPTNDITVRNGNTGKPSGSLTYFDNGATVVDDGWFPWGNSIRTVTVTVPGGQVEVEVAGRLIVPPQQAISLQVVADTTAATFTAGFMWYEVQLAIE